MSTNDDDGDEALATDVENSNAEGGGEAPTRELPTAPSAGAGDHCTNCGAPLAHDQRYCVECGERRGQSRMPTPAQPVTEVRTTRTRTVAEPRRRTTLSSGTTLVLGVGVLLLAIGLGVLIGSLKNNTTTTKASAPQVITVQGGSGGTGAATTAPTTTTAPKLNKASKAKLKAAAKTTAAPPPAVQKKATQAAGKVLGNSQHLAPPTVTTGGSCSNGQAGCSGGKFNGNFFGQ